MPHNLVAVLREIKPRKALFTTYTFSPDFFEAAVLRHAFQLDGCEVNVLVDGGPLAASTRSSHAHHVGRRYSVAPVSIPSGIFHPKFALLVSDERQVLCVASSNLTAAGQSIQLENFDVVDLDTHSDVGEQLRDFLLGLARRCESSSLWACRTLKRAAEWIRSPSTNEADPGNTFLVHTLEHSAAEQLAQLVKRRSASVRRLTVLAPFHSANGKGVGRLTELMNPQKLRIAHVGTVPCLPTAHPDATFVVPVHAVAARALHAKVFEAETDKEALIFTGSVNATFTSLGSVRNIEVGLARWLRTSPFQWKAEAPKAFAPIKQLIEAPPTWTAEAMLRDGYVLEALIQGAKSAGANVDWSLYLNGAELEQGVSSLRADGVLRVTLTSVVNPGREALHLHVSGPCGEEARTWVNDQRSLSAVRRGVSLSNGTASEDPDGDREVFALIDQALAGRAVSGPSTSGGSARGGKRGAVDEGTEDEDFSYSEWMQTGSLRRPPASTLHRPTGFVLSLLLRLLDEHLEEVGDEGIEGNDNYVPTPALDEPNAEDEDGQKRERRDGSRKDLEKEKENRQRRREQVSQACDKIKAAFETRQEGIFAPEALAAAVFTRDVKRAVRYCDGSLDKMSSAFDAHRVFVLWLHFLSFYRFEDQAREDLLPLAAAMSVTACAIRAHRDPAERHLSQLRSSLNRLAGRSVSGAEIARLADDGLQHIAMKAVARRFRDECIEQIEPLALARSLDDLLGLTIDGQRHPELSASMAGVSPVLARLRDRNHGLAVVGKAEVSHGGCPICGRHFTDSERRDLAYERYLVHHNGGQHVLIYPDEPTRFFSRP